MDDIKRRLDDAAKLAALEISEEEREEFAAGLEEMLAFCGCVKSYDEGEGVPLCVPAESLREDVVEKSLPREELIKGGGEYFTVEQVIK